MAAAVIVNGGGGIFFFYFLEKFMEIAFAIDTGDPPLPPHSYQMLESFGFEIGIVCLIQKLISNVLFLVNGTMDIVKCIYIYIFLFFINYRWKLFVKKKDKNICCLKLLRRFNFIRLSDSKRHSISTFDKQIGIGRNSMISLPRKIENCVHDKKKNICQRTSNEKKT